ncbi:hypothetical protein EXIGLDRAFT_842715 [Exidia glandulosa HHB12029]|uniref:Uncharacterized protein n=1 Tax=Exidia glandulosa HHB12029 TaxID=1314781 RepID=A0A165D4B6_EXIGL|nr:hypothetical protein EXIGLDRAFT_842715 [Exidia glandulosa HHB12029]
MSSVRSVSQAMPLSNPFEVSSAQLPKVTSSSAAPGSESATTTPSPSFSPCALGTGYPFYASTPIVSTEVPVPPGVKQSEEVHDYQTIVMMPEYRHKSTEELRVEDYSVGRTSPTAVAANFEVAFKPFAWASTPGHPAAFSAHSTRSVDAVPPYPGHGHRSVSPTKTTSPSSVGTVEATSSLPLPPASWNLLCTSGDAKGTSSPMESSFRRRETLPGDGSVTFPQSVGGKIHPFLSTSIETFNADATSFSGPRSSGELPQSQHPSSTPTSLLDDYSSHKLCNRRLDAEVEVRRAEEILRRAAQARCATLEEDLKGLSRALDVKSSRIQALEEQLTEAQLARRTADEAHAKIKEERDDLRDRLTRLEPITESTPVVARVDAPGDATH